MDMNYVRRICSVLWMNRGSYAKSSIHESKNFCHRDELHQYRNDTLSITNSTRIVMSSLYLIYLRNTLICERRRQCKSQTLHTPWWTASGIATLSCVWKRQYMIISTSITVTYCVRSISSFLWSNTLLHDHLILTKCISSSDKNIWKIDLNAMSVLDMQCRWV